jgi:hypothetical protein
MTAFLEVGVKFRSITNLHAKIVVVDDSFALVGSNNLTAGGMAAHNVELGVIMRSRNAVQAVAAVFNYWWDRTSEADEFDAKMLKKIRKKVVVRKRSSDPLVGHSLATPATEKFEEMVKRNRRDRAIASLRSNLVPPGKPLPRNDMEFMPDRHAAAYRQVRTLRERVTRARAETDQARETLLLVLARHKAPDARAHAAWRLSHDQWLVQQHRSEIAAALKQQHAADPARVVVRAAKAGMTHLGEQRREPKRVRS